MTFKQKIKSLLEIDVEEIVEGEGLDGTAGVYISDNGLGSAKGWPKGNDGYFQSLENLEFLSIQENSIKIFCGGDGQEPMVIEIGLVNDELTVLSHEIADGYMKGMGNNFFLELLNQEDEI